MIFFTLFLTGMSLLASRRSGVYTRLSVVKPSEHDIFSQMVPPAPGCPFPVLKARRPGVQNQL